MKDIYPVLTAVGYFPRFGSKGTVIPGLQTPFFGSPKNPCTQVIAKDGTVTNFQLGRSLQPHEYVAAAYPVVPQEGLPHMCSFVPDPTHPNLLEMFYWPDMARRILRDYQAVPPMLVAHPISAAHVATFILAQVPGYLKEPGCTETLDLSPYALEQERLAADNEHIFSRSSEVRQIVQSWHEDNAPTPGGPAMTP